MKIFSDYHSQASLLKNINKQYEKNQPVKYWSVLFT